MLYAFVGDVVESRKRAHTLGETYEKKGFSSVRVAEENYAPGMLRSYAQGQSLFGKGEVILLDTLGSVPDALQELEEVGELLRESANIFILIDLELPAAISKIVKKYAEEYVEIKATVRESFNIFALGDALARKDKKSLWVLYIRARKGGVSSEELIGTLFWQLKMLRLALMTATPEEAGMKDFPYRKAKSALKNFKDGELQKLSDDLVLLYHQGHGGETDIDLALEKWILGM